MQFDPVTPFKFAQGVAESYGDQAVLVRFDAFGVRLLYLDFRFVLTCINIALDRWRVCFKVHIRNHPGILHKRNGTSPVVQFLLFIQLIQ